MRLINKKHLAVSKVASRDATRYVLNGIKIEETETGVKTIATDGKSLAIVETVGMIDKPEDFPAVPGMDTAPNAATAGIIPIDTVEKVIKAIPKKTKLPILGSALLKMSAELATFGTTDLDTAQVIPSRVIVGHYPNYQQVIPEGKPEAVVSFDPGKMIEMMKIAIEVVGKGNPITMELRGALNPMKFINKSDTIKFTGALMPMKG